MESARFSLKCFNTDYIFIPSGIFNGKEKFRKAIHRCNPAFLMRTPRLQEFGIL